MAKFQTLLMMMVFAVVGARADEVPPVVEKAINDIARLNLPPDGKGSCSAKAASFQGMATAAAAKGTNHVNPATTEGNAEKSCDAYISDDGSVGEKGKWALDVLMNRVPGNRAKADTSHYQKLFLSDDSVMGKEGSDDYGHGGVSSLCPKFSEMKPEDRAKAYVKLLGAIAEVQTGCKNAGTADSAGKNLVGDFLLEKNVKAHKARAPWDSKSGFCSANSVHDARNGVLCALAMLGQQLQAKTAAEKAETDPKKQREPGIISKASYWDFLRPPEDGQDEHPKYKRIVEIMKKYKPCGGGD